MLFSTERAVSQLCAWLEQVDKKDGTGGVHGRIVTSDDAAQVTTIYLATVTCFYCGLDVRRRHLCCLQQFAVSQNKDRRIGCIFGLSFVWCRYFPFGLFTPRYSRNTAKVGVKHQSILSNVKEYVYIANSSVENVKRSGRSCLNTLITDLVMTVCPM